MVPSALAIRSAATMEGVPSLEGDQWDEELLGMLEAVEASGD